ncbi:MAG TPA: hypothetical protein VK832_03950, partial [Burkholderiaceae bacterium]|nr:hypothetical protein [Burkholderiaceae bacterium]
MAMQYASRKVSVGLKEIPASHQPAITDQTEQTKVAVGLHQLQPCETPSSLFGTNLEGCNIISIARDIAIMAKFERVLIPLQKMGFDHNKIEEFKAKTHLPCAVTEAAGAAWDDINDKLEVDDAIDTLEKLFCGQGGYEPLVTVNESKDGH